MTITCNVKVGDRVRVSSREVEWQGEGTVMVLYTGSKTKRPFSIVKFDISGLHVVPQQFLEVLT